MSEETTNEDAVPAILSEGEAVVPAVDDTAKEALADLVDKYNKAAAPVEAEESKPDSGTITTASIADGKKSNKEAEELAPLDNGVIGVAVAKKSEPKAATKKAAKPVAKEDTVAIHSTRNVTWGGVGKVYTGYNIVTKEAADQWIKRDHIRLATPEEVAKEYGN